MKKTLLCSVATLGGVGRFYGSGTLATVLTLPVVYGLSLLPIGWYVVAVVVLFVISLKASDVAVAYYGKQDPAEVVIDEVIGCLITFIAIPITWYSLAAGFVLFRFFDISKCLGIKKFGNLRGAWGVVLDDVAAGVVSNILLYLIFVVCCSL